MTITIEARPLVVVGAGGHGREILDVVAAVNAVHHTWIVRGVFADDDPGDALSRHGIPWLGRLESGETLAINAATVHTATVNTAPTEYIVAIGDPATRERVAAICATHGWEPATLVHSGASLGSHCSIGGGTVLFNASVLTTGITLGPHVHINTRASVSHDCTIAAFATVGPAAVLCGGVSIGMRAYIGAAAVVLPGLRVGDDAMVGAGAIVVCDVADGARVKGIPAR